MNKATTTLVSLLAILAPFAVQAHKTWILPSQTIVADKGSWITVDAAVSNDLFFFNHVPLRIERLEVIAPDGSRIKAQNATRGKYRTTFDLPLEQTGTYRLAVTGDTLTARYELDGETKRWRGTTASLAGSIPAAAKNVVLEHYQQRIETFVTAGKPSAVNTPSGSGLELAGMSHPNDLYAGEPAKLRFLIDGQPAAGITVEIAAGGSRYRDRLDEKVMQTDSAGVLEFTWPEAGMYWLEAVATDDKSPVQGAQKRHATYTGTFEVLPP